MVAQEGLDEAAQKQLSVMYKLNTEIVLSLLGFQSSPFFLQGIANCLIFINVSANLVTWCGNSWATLPLSAMSATLLSATRCCGGSAVGSGSD